MNDDLYNEIYDEAASLFRTYNSQIKGQTVSNMDNFEYWIMYVAYNKGCIQGYDDCWKERLEENGE